MVIDSPDKNGMCAICEESPTTMSAIDPDIAHSDIQLCRNDTTIFFGFETQFVLLKMPICLDSTLNHCPPLVLVFLSQFSL